MDNNYQVKALIEAEKRGIVTYNINGNKLVYYANYPMEKMTYRVVINLDTNKEERTALSGYYQKGNDNMYL